MELHALQPSYMLYEYRIEKLLGEGGFGLTYLAFDTLLEKKVAIKEYMPSEHSIRKNDSKIVAKSTSSEKVYRWGLNAFLNEAKILAKFEDANIVRIYRFFEANGTAYIVMEYCEGGCLVDIISKKEHMPEEQLKEIISSIVHGLQLVHNDGILHRDIKPDNIMFREDGTAVLIDFGAARQAIGNKTKKVTTIITPGYAPLEQYSSKGEIGPWSDIYSLAAVAYLCLTGEKPPDIMNRLHEDTIKRLANTPESSTFLQSLDKALNLHVKDRPQSLSEWTKGWKDFQLPKTVQSNSNNFSHNEPIYAEKKVEDRDFHIPISARNSAEPDEMTRVAYAALSEDKQSQNSFFKLMSYLIFIGLLAFISFYIYDYHNKHNGKLPFISAFLEESNKTNTTKEQQQKDLILNVQKQLNQLKYLVPENGILDIRTQNSIKAFEKQKQLIITGQADAILLDLLIQENKFLDQKAWEQAQDTNTKKAYEDYLKSYPHGQYAALVPKTLIDLQLDKKKQAQKQNILSQHELERLEQIAQLKIQLIKDIQLQLKRLKYKNLNADGQLNADTKNAIKSYQKLKKSDVNGLPTKTLLFQLKSESAWPGNIFGQTFKDCTQCPTMVVIPDGDYMMGSTDGDSSEQPRHHVNIKEFAMSQTEVTFKQWDVCIADGGCIYQPDDEGHGRQNQALINVSYNDAQQYLKWLNQITQKNYRLPSETEWEYAAKSGSDTVYSWGNYIGINHVNCRECDFNGVTNVVKQFPANNFGLYDMHGNVWEWVEDCWHSNYSGAPSDNESWEPIACNIFVTRGGSSNSPAKDLRAAKRGNMNADKRMNSLGFRVALSLD